MPAIMLKSYVQSVHSQCRFSKLKILYIFKNFVSLLSRHTSYIVFFYCHITRNFCGGSVHIVTRLRIVQAGGGVLFRQRPEGFWCPSVCLTNAAGTLSVEGRAVAQWLRHYATNRQVAGSIPDGVIGIFQ